MCSLDRQRSEVGLSFRCELIRRLAKQSSQSAQLVFCWGRSWSSRGRSWHWLQPGQVGGPNRLLRSLGSICIFFCHRLGSFLRPSWSTIRSLLPVAPGSGAVGRIWSILVATICTIRSTGTIGSIRIGRSRAAGSWLFHLLSLIPMRPWLLAPLPVLWHRRIAPVTRRTCPGNLLVEATTLTFPGLELHLVEDLGKMSGISRVMSGQGDVDLLQLLAIEGNPPSCVQEPLPACGRPCTALRPSLRWRNSGCTEGCQRGPQWCSAKLAHEACTTKSSSKRCCPVKGRALLQRLQRPLNAKRKAARGNRAKKPAKEQG
jgi:hypothetical protein